MKRVLTVKASHPSFGMLLTFTDSSIVGTQAMGPWVAKAGGGKESATRMTDNRS